MAANLVLNPNELKAHLNLLRAFHNLKSQVEDGSESELDANPEKRWESFVRVSVDRYVGHEISFTRRHQHLVVVDSTNGFLVSR